MVLCLATVGTYLWLTSSKLICLQNLNYIKKQQEQAEAKQNNIIKAINSESLF